MLNSVAECWRRAAFDSVNNCANAVVALTSEVDRLQAQLDQRNAVVEAAARLMPETWRIVAVELRRLRMITAPGVCLAVADALAAREADDDSPRG